MEALLRAAFDNLVASFSASILAAIILFFPLTVGIAFTAAVVWLLKSNIDAQATILYGTVFSIFGLSVAYIYTKPGTDILAEILPPAIAGVIVLFQLLGRLNPKWDIPLESHASLVGATAGVFCFIFGSIYFEAAPLPARGEGQGGGLSGAPEPPISDEEADLLIDGM